MITVHKIRVFDPQEVSDVRIKHLRVWLVERTLSGLGAGETSDVHINSNWFITVSRRDIGIQVTSSFWVASIDGSGFLLGPGSSTAVNITKALLDRIYAGGAKYV